jgi:hypothetical protein
MMSFFLEILKLKKQSNGNVSDLVMDTFKVFNELITRPLGYITAKIARKCFPCPQSI